MNDLITIRTECAHDKTSQQCKLNEQTRLDRQSCWVVGGFFRLKIQRQHHLKMNDEDPAKNMFG